MNIQFPQQTPNPNSNQFADVFNSNPFFQNPEAFFRNAQNNGGYVHTSFSNNTSNNFNVYNNPTQPNSQQAYHNYNQPHPTYHQNSRQEHSEPNYYHSQSHPQPHSPQFQQSNLPKSHQKDYQSAIYIQPMDPQAEKLNRLGNNFYENGKYKDAITQYQRALTFQQHWRLHKNLAWAYRRLNLFKESLQFIEKAIQLQPNDPKLLRLGGIFAFSLFRNSENAKHAKRGLKFFREALCQAPNVPNRHNFLTASKTLFLFKQKHLQSKRSELLDYLKDLPKPTNSDFQIAGQDDVYSEQELESLLQPTYFDQQPEVPHHLKGKISLEIMLEPVQTPSGISYDYENIYRAFSEQGLKDPISGIVYNSPDCLIRNLALENLIDDFLQEKPWAYLQEDFDADWKFFEFK